MGFFPVSKFCDVEKKWTTMRLAFKKGYWKKYNDVWNRNKGKKMLKRGQENNVLNSVDLIIVVYIRASWKSLFKMTISFGSCVFLSQNLENDK